MLARSAAAGSIESRVVRRDLGEKGPAVRMSGGRDGGAARSTLLGRFIDSFRRPHSQPRQEQRPVVEDLGLKTLRNVYAQYTQTEEPLEKERRLYKMLPLFLKNCSRLKGSELVTKFPECLEFSEHVALLFVRHVTQIAQTHGSRACEALLTFLDVNDGAEPGVLMLKVLQVGGESEETYCIIICTTLCVCLSGRGECVYVVSTCLCSMQEASGTIACVCTVCYLYTQVWLL